MIRKFTLFIVIIFEIYILIVNDDISADLTISHLCFKVSVAFGFYILNLKLKVSIFTYDSSRLHYT
jgi:hypothetical protein